MQPAIKPQGYSRGIVPFQTAGDLARLEEEKKAAEKSSTHSPFIDSLSAYIENCWIKARDAKDQIEREMLMSLRQRNGEYEADKLSAIHQMGGSEVYVLLTATKCRAAEAWINDVLRGASERPWSIEPTPIPELPGDLEEQIRQEVFQVSQELVSQATAANQMFPDGALIEELREYARSRKDEVLRELQEEAGVRSERMATRIEDQMKQGGWHESFSEVVSDFVTMKASVLKGPVIRRRKVQKWVQGPSGWAVETVDQLVPEYDRVSPFDLYPAPDSRAPDDGYLIERHRLTRSELQALIGVPGYSEQNIRKALSEYRDGHYSAEPIDHERARIEFHGETEQQWKGEKIEALEFWGHAPGKDLIDWGMEGDIDPDLEYEINAWKVGDYVIRAILNPDNLGRKPYSVDSYERIPGSFWGKGIPDLMRDVQDICNAVARAIVNNSAMASGPQVEVNVGRCEGDNEEIWPWKIWQATNQQMTEAPAVNFFQPQIVVDPLMKVFEFFSAQSEDQTGIPRWAYGNSDVGGAGSTSSGLSMLMGQASKGIKEAISHLDRMVGAVVERTYDYNMTYDEDEGIKGDCRIVARGSSSLLVKEQKLMRTREVLAATNNPTDMEIMGLEGRAKLLKEALRDLDIPSEEIIPDEKGIKDLIQKIEQRNMMAMAAQQQMEGAPKGSVPGKAPQSLDAAGNPAGGVEANLFQNQAGQTPGLRTVPT